MLGGADIEENSLEHYTVKNAFEAREFFPLCKGLFPPTSGKNLFPSIQRNFTHYTVSGYAFYFQLLSPIKRVIIQCFLTVS